MQSWNGRVETGVFDLAGEVIKSLIVPAHPHPVLCPEKNEGWQRIRDAYDEGVIATMFAGVSASSPNHVLGSDNATDLAAGTFDGTGNLDIGFAANEHDQLGDTTTLADPTVVESLVENRKNK